MKALNCLIIIVLLSTQSHAFFNSGSSYPSSDKAFKDYVKHCWTPGVLAALSLGCLDFTPYKYKNQTGFKCRIIDSRLGSNHALDLEGFVWQMRVTFRAELPDQDSLVTAIEDGEEYQIANDRKHVYVRYNVMIMHAKSIQGWKYYDSDFFRGMLAPYEKFEDDPVEIK